MGRHYESYKFWNQLNAESTFTGDSRLILGIEAREREDKSGITVENVLEDSVAEKTGIEVDDVITEINSDETGFLDRTAGSSGKSGGETPR